MNVSAERSRSVWMDTEVTPAPALDREEKADVAVIGSGIAGLSTAYELAARGKSVVVLDRGPLAGGMTARTTAHLASALDDFYFELIDLRGAEQAKLHYESQAAAVERIETIQAEEGISCDFARLDGYFFTPEGADPAVPERELKACQQIGVKAELGQAPIEAVQNGPALRFSQQGRVHPLKYLNGLIAAIQRRGGRLYAETCATTVEEDERGVVVSTAPGHKVRAAAAVVATNSPINERITIHTKQAPYRTYVIALRAPRGAIVDALYWDTLDPYHYVRLQPGSESDLLIVGGEDHRSGQADDAEARFAALEEWTRRYFPQAREVTHRWSGQVQEPVDYTAFLGRNPGSERIYVATGDSGQGITNGVVASLLIAALIVEGESPWSRVYDPARKPVGAATQYLRENMVAVKNFAEYLTGGDVASLDALKPGQGAVVRHGFKKIAAYRDEGGKVHLRSAVCPHAGCIVHWNSFEQCWDCPCHGSQFGSNGIALNGPAISPLEAIDV
ncbi:MAG TPA: FAD-dependent oxidoreductase [Xanthobacteraceae bacterium]|nr:FAD-dependent oxidoreductase [Xanthobacteraceae bacterium]